MSSQYDFAIADDDVLQPGTILGEVAHPFFDFAVEERNGKFLFVHVRVKAWGTAQYREMLDFWADFCSQMRAKGLARIYCHAETEKTAKFQQMFGFVPEAMDVFAHVGHPVLRQVLEL